MTYQEISEILLMENLLPHNGKNITLAEQKLMQDIDAKLSNINRPVSYWSKSSGNKSCICISLNIHYLYSITDNGSYNICTPGGYRYITSGLRDFLERNSLLSDNDWQNIKLAIKMQESFEAALEVEKQSPLFYEFFGLTSKLIEEIKNYLLLHVLHYNGVIHIKVRENIKAGSPNCHVLLYNGSKYPRSVYNVLDIVDFSDPHFDSFKELLREYKDYCLRLAEADKKAADEFISQYNTQP